MGINTGKNARNRSRGTGAKAWRNCQNIYAMAMTVPTTIRKLGRRPARGVLLESRLFDRRLRHHPQNYVFQSALCMVALLAIILVVDVVLRAAIVVGVASSAFIVFMLPHSRAATPRRVVGGHTVAVAVGTALSLAYLVPGWGDLAAMSPAFQNLIAVLAVGLGFLIMILTNTEHPPAVGTALGLVVADWTLSTALFVLLGVLMLSGIHMALRPWLKNLL